MKCEKEGCNKKRTCFHYCHKHHQEICMAGRAKNWKLSVIFLMLSVLACGMPVVKAGVVAPARVSKDTHINSEMSTDVNTAEMVVCNSGGLNVRYQPADLSTAKYQLADGESVTVRIPATVTEDMGLWYQLADGGWVNGKYLCDLYNPYKD